MIQLNENHFPNTVYLKAIGRLIKNIYYCIQNYPTTLLVGRMKSPNKARKYKICTDVFLTHHYNVTFQSKLISFFNFLRNYSRRQHLQNEGNRTSKKLRSRQIETKSLMGKGVFSSLVVTSKSEYL